MDFTLLSEIEWVISEIVESIFVDRSKLASPLQSMCQKNSSYMNYANWWKSLIALLSKL